MTDCKSFITQFFDWLEKQPKSSQNLLIKTLCTVLIIISIGAASGLTIGVGAYIYDAIHNTKILEKITPNGRGNNGDIN